MATTRQQAWADAARHSDGVAAALFGALAQPNEQERGHNHREHPVGFRRGSRRGLKCGIDGTVIRWIDPPVPGADDSESEG
jgi:hypothetical protein